MLQVTLDSTTTSTPNKFVQRLLEVIFILAPPSPGQPAPNFTGQTGNQVKLSGLRMSAHIVKAGGRFKSSAQIDIYGMSLSLMNDLSTLGMRLQFVPGNSVIVLAGNAIDGMATVFQGTIISAWADFSNMPDVPFHVEAIAGMNQAVINVPPSSYQGSVDVATVFSSLATLAGLGFDNQGVVNQKINCPYLPGSPMDQIDKFRDTTRWIVDSIIEPGQTNSVGTLIIWPKNKSRGGQIPVVSADTCLVKAPSYNTMGIILTTLFNPSIGYGGQIKVVSALLPTSGSLAASQTTNTKVRLLPANGIWTVYGLNYDLETQVPQGQWFTQILAYNKDFAPPIIPTA